MARVVVAVAVLALGVSAGYAQQPFVGPPTPPEKGTYLGVLLSPARGAGVKVAQVLRDSPADKADLRRDDVLLEYDAEKIRDCEHCAQLIQTSKPKQKIRLRLVRDGREVTAEPVLDLGPVLKLAADAKPAEMPRAEAKPGGPASVSVSATPLDGGAMKVTFEYYQENTGKLKSVTCRGTAEEIDKEVLKLPARIQQLAQVALQRIRDRATSDDRGTPEK